MSNFAIEAEIDGAGAIIIKRSGRSIQVNNGVLYCDDIGIEAKTVDFSTEHVITLRIRPAP